MKKRFSRLMILTFMLLFSFNISTSANSNTPSTNGNLQTDETEKSNKDINKLVEVAYELGKSGKTYKLPPEYSESEQVFKAHYEKGFNEYEENQKNHEKIVNVGAGMLFFAWLCRRFYVARKMIS